MVGRAAFETLLEAACSGAKSRLGGDGGALGAVDGAGAGEATGAGVGVGEGGRVGEGAGAEGGAARRGAGASTSWIAGRTRRGGRWWRTATRCTLVGGRA